jgi:hypothetical protein
VPRPPMPAHTVLHNPSRHVCSFKLFLFILFRTLWRNGALATPLPSIVSALFPIQRPGWVGSLFITSRVPYILPSSVCPNSFVCRSYENWRVYTLSSHSGTGHPTSMRVPAGSSPVLPPIRAARFLVLVPYLLISLPPCLPFKSFKIAGSFSISVAAHGQKSALLY